MSKAAIRLLHCLASLANLYPLLSMAFGGIVERWSVLLRTLGQGEVSRRGVGFDKVDRCDSLYTSAVFRRFLGSWAFLAGIIPFVSLCLRASLDLLGMDAVQSSPFLARSHEGTKWRFDRVLECDSLCTSAVSRRFWRGGPPWQDHFLCVFVPSCESNLPGMDATQ